jgi:hypothetical protein
MRREKYKKKENLEYKVENGQREEFSNDIEDYYVTRIKLSGETKIRYTFQRKQEIKNKYNIDEKRFQENLLIYFKKLSRQFGGIF